MDPLSAIDAFSDHVPSSVNIAGTGVKNVVYEKLNKSQQQ